jgi:hypothetical protein
MANVLDNASEPVSENESLDASEVEESIEDTPQKELSDDLKAELKALIKKFGFEEMPNRRIELIKAREQRFFWSGNQYPMYNSDNGSWAVPETGGFPFSSDSAGGGNRFYYVTNIYTPYGKTLISSLVGQAPAVRFMPCDPFDIDDIDASKEAEKYKSSFYYEVDMGQLLKDVGRYAYTDGRVVAHIFNEENGAKYGYDSDGKPKTKQRCEVYGVLEAKVPISLREQCEFPYIQISTERHVTELKAKYPDIADQIKDNASGPSEDAFDRICRLGVMQGQQASTGADTYSHLVTYQQTWLRTSAFTFIKDKSKRAELEEMYPKGVRVCYAGDTFLEAVEESMDEHIAVFLPQPGDGQSVPSLGCFLVPVQKRLNNLSNLAQEAYEKGSPSKFVDSKAIDTEAMADQLASPEVYFPVKRPAGEALSNLFYKEETSSLGQELVGMINNLQGSTAQFVSGAQPALFGGAMTNSKTAAVYAQARDQALGALAITYGPLKLFLAKVTELAVNCAEAIEGDIVGITPDSKGQYQPTKVSTDKLRAGDYRCHPEVDEGFPESYSAQRASFQQMIQFMGADPNFQKLMTQPDNQYLFKTMTGIKGFEVPGADSRNKQLREIEELLEGSPIQPTPEEVQKIALHQTMLQASGQPATPPKPEDLLQSSVPIDPIFDDNSVEFQECVRWINSDEGQKAKMFNPQGFENVRLHGIAHQRAMQGGPDNAPPMQQQVPNPQQAIQAARAQAALQQHSEEQQEPEGGEAPPAFGPQL